MQTELKIIMKPVNEIIPYWRNPRRNDVTVEELVKTIPVAGFNVPIVVDKHGVVVKGHARLKAAKRLGMTEVPVIVSNASDEAIKADRIADNKIQEMSGWDFGKLNMELDKLDGKMTFGRLFRPEDGVSQDELQDMPDVGFTPVGLDFGGADAEVAEVTEVMQGQAEYGYEAPTPPQSASGGAGGMDMPAHDAHAQGDSGAPQKRTLKTLCPYCGKVVYLNV